MARIAYLDQNKLLGKCYLTRDYSALQRKILSEHNSYTKSLYVDGEIYGYHIDINRPLTELYSFPCYVVKFIFSNVDTLHVKCQEEIMNELCSLLKKDIANIKGYYMMRVPTHICDLIRAIDQNITGTIFCGGTVEYIFTGPFNLPTWNDNLELFFADSVFIENNKDKLESIAIESFKRYQGQYHISPVTSECAPQIYKNWLKSSLDDYKENELFVSTYENEIVGFCTILEDITAVEAVLAAVTPAKRELGTYKALISLLVQYAKKRNKIFVTGTQFDNFVVQRAWGAIGLRPFYSIYNIHLDSRI